MTTQEQTMPKAPTLEQLEQEQAEAMARVQAARAAADRLREQAEQRRSDAQRKHDEELLSAWAEDRAALEQDIAAARQQLREAVLADPVWTAYRALVLAGHRLTTRTLEADNTKSRLHGPQPYAPTPILSAPSWEELARMVEQDATAEGRDEAAAREQRREDVGSAAYEQQG